MIDAESERSNGQQTMERGLLDLSVALSTRNITAGKQFAIFVLVKNPFDKPVWVRQVHVSLPSELKLAEAKRKEKQKRGEKNSNENDFQRRKEEQMFRLETKLNILNTEFIKASERFSNNNSLDEDIKNFINKVETKITEVKDELKNLVEENQTNIRIGSGSSVNNIKVISKQPNIEFGNEVSIDCLELYDPESFRDVSAQAQKVDLESSLPKNVALQPGSTVVYTAVLYVERSLVFSPSQYRLQFNVNYSFHAKKALSSNEEYEQGEEAIFTNTAAHELSIRPSVYSVITGAGLGGLTGAVARLLQVTTSEKWQLFSSIDIFTSSITIVVAVILSGIAVVFMARKSEAQSFVSVEDFWGGLLIGFLVGYTGTSFFEQLTGVINPTPTNPNQRFPLRP